MLKIVIFRISFLLITVSKIYRANIKRERMIRISPELIPRMNISLKMMFMFICSPPTPKHAFNVSSEAHFCYLKLLETHFCYLKASSGFLHSPICYLGYQSSLPPTNSMVANQRLGYRTRVKVHKEQNHWLQISGPWYSVVRTGESIWIRTLTFDGYKKKIL